MDVLNPAYLVHIAAGFYIAAFLVRDELILRGLALMGSLLYLLYYFFAPAIPLWDAIFTGSLLIFANIYVMARIVLERTIFGLSDDEKALYRHIKLLTPGQFRKLLKLGCRRTAGGSDVLTRQGEVPEALYYIIHGEALGHKDGQPFTILAGHFVGEISFVLENQTASADVNASTDMDYLSWDVTALRRSMEKSLPFKNAMIALLSVDLAVKLEDSFKAERL